MFIQKKKKAVWRPEVGQWWPNRGKSESIFYFTAVFAELFTRCLCQAVPPTARMRYEREVS